MNGLNLLINKAKFYSNEVWGIEYNFEIEINQRLKKTVGKYIYGNKIVLARFIMDNEYIIDDALMHELCHWYCYSILKKGWTDFGTTFINEIKKTGATLTNSISKINDKYYHGQKEYVPDPLLVELNNKYYKKNYVA